MVSQLEQLQVQDKRQEMFGPPTHPLCSERSTMEHSMERSMVGAAPEAGCQS